jgi:hypothetical protein
MTDLQVAGRGRVDVDVETQTEYLCPLVLSWLLLGGTASLIAIT